MSNWVTGSASLTQTVTKSAVSLQAADITVSLAANRFDVASDAALKVQATAFINKCRTVSTLSFKWTQTSGPTYYIPDKAAVGSMLVIPPNSLTPAQTYVFAVMVTADTYGTKTNSTSRSVTVKVTSIPAPTLVSATISLTEAGLDQVSFFCGAYMVIYDRVICVVLYLLGLVIISIYLPIIVITIITLPLPRQLYLCSTWVQTALVCTAIAPAPK